MCFVLHDNLHHYFPSLLLVDFLDSNAWFLGQLCRYGVPIIDKVPDGFSPLAEVWGRGMNRDPLLVTFVHPIDWIVTLPSQDVNGEDGTIQAGEYGKGDTATFFVYKEPGKVEVSEWQFV
jgi:hypothetical protein